jgi:hypothetical protein
MLPHPTQAIYNLDPCPVTRIPSIGKKEVYIAINLEHLRKQFG